MTPIPRGDVGDVCTIDENGGSSHSGSTEGSKFGPLRSFRQPIKEKGPMRFPGGVSRGQVPQSWALIRV